MVDEFDDEFYPEEESFPPQTKEEFQKLIDHHKEDISIDNKFIQKLEETIDAQGGEATEDQDEELEYAYDRIEEARRFIAYYEDMLNRLAKGLQVPV